MAWLPVDTSPTYVEITGIDAAEADAAPAVLVAQDGVILALSVEQADAWEPSFVLPGAWNVAPPVFRQAP